MTPQEERAQIVEMFNIVDGLAWAGSFDKIDEYFDAIDVVSSTTVLLIACVRFTYMYRDKLKSWQPLLKRIEAEFRERETDGVNERTDSLLHGLL